MMRSTARDGSGGKAAYRASANRSLGRGLRLVAIATALLAVAVIGGLWLAYLHFDRTPGEIVRYAQHRLIGHPTLEFVALPALLTGRKAVERPIERPLPTLGKGQQAEPLLPQRYSTEGRPVISVKRNVPGIDLQAGQLLFTESEIQQAVANARPGQVLEIAPGTYSLKARIHARTSGLPENPIVVRARTPGSVTILTTAVEGFYVTAPYWVFENLVIRGQCQEDSGCEHAFHVVGKARNTVIRNNRIEDFNAQIKINGVSGDWPDYGLIQYNTLTNTRRRNTANPVTPIDLVAANGWHVTDNRISNFVKGGGNQISYGVFMKGAGSGGRIERNLIICTEKDISQPGARVGLSFGGGGSDASKCRDQRCITEHSQGIATNNIIAHCNDVGIYINKSNQTLVAHNTLINTYGIDVRFASSSARVIGNLVQGRIRERDGGIVESKQNHFATSEEIFDKHNDVILDWRTILNAAVSHPEVNGDFCGKPRTDPAVPGAVAESVPCRE